MTRIALNVEKTTNHTTIGSAPLGIEPKYEFNATPQTNVARSWLIFLSLQYRIGSSLSCNT